ncbi:MAG: hypothetical protein D6719_03535 [Candidatus Dadabacteria bacterium]|nr:MAG: hypothetical protein D6719_03535 [Candidatus Dadabacteria bacterium]
MYQATDQKSRIIVSRRVPGIFIASGSKFSIQLFNPQKLDLKSTSHIFVGYNPRARHYDYLQSGSNRYHLNGSLVILFDNLRITIDNNNPYLSVVIDTHTAGEAPAIIGFHGLNEVIRSSGEEDVALLEANQFKEFREIIKPYLLKDGRLYLDNQSVEKGSSVGLTIEAVQSICTKRPGRTVTYIKNDDLQKIRKISGSDRRRYAISRLLSESKHFNPLADTLLLKSDKRQMILLDYKNSAVMLVKPLNPKKTDNPVCIVQKILLK